MAGENANSQPRNRLLQLLPKSLETRVIRDCELMHLDVKHILYEPNKPIRDIYFPVNGVVSLIATMDNGMEVEVATTGNEGMLGIPVFLGTDQTPLKAFSQVPGDALRLPVSDFRKYVEDEPELVRILHRFAEALMMQISQSTACNRAHPIEQRCCRWLLMTHDRTGRAEFTLTQEFLAQMLGVRRATVGEVASGLQEAKLIQYSRGLIKILNRRGLEKRSCGCYFVIRDEYERLLSSRGPELVRRRMQI